MYEKLSYNTHGLPDYLDTGRILHSKKDLFRDREILPDHLIEYFDTLHHIMDITMIVTLNLLKNNIETSDEVKNNLIALMKNDSFLSLKLENTIHRIKQLIDEKI